MRLSILQYEYVTGCQVVSQQQSLTCFLFLDAVGGWGTVSGLSTALSSPSRLTTKDVVREQVLPLPPLPLSILFDGPGS